MKKTTLFLSFLTILTYCEETSFYEATASKVLKDQEAQYPNLAAFLNRYGCSSEVEQTIADTPKEYLKAHVYKAGDYYIKDRDRRFNEDAIERIVYAKAYERMLKNENISDITVAQKCLSKDFKVVAKKVIADPSIPYKYLSKLSFTGYQDAHGGNAIMADDQNMVVIDTEKISFYEDMREDILKNYLDIDLIKVLEEAENFKKYRETIPAKNAQKILEYYKFESLKKNIRYFLI